MCIIICMYLYLLPLYWCIFYVLYQRPRCWLKSRTAKQWTCGASVSSRTFCCVDPRRFTTRVTPIYLHKSSKVISLVIFTRLMEHTHQLKQPQSQHSVGRYYSVPVCKTKQSQMLNTRNEISPTIVDLLILHRVQVTSGNWVVPKACFDVLLIQWIT